MQLRWYRGKSVLEVYFKDGYFFYRKGGMEMKDKKTLTNEEMAMLKGFDPNVNHFGAGRFTE